MVTAEGCTFISIPFRHQRVACLARRQIIVSFLRKKRCIVDLSGTVWQVLHRFVPVCRACRRMLPSPHPGQRFVLRRFLAGRVERLGVCFANEQHRPRQTARQRMRPSEVISCWFLSLRRVFCSCDPLFAFRMSQGRFSSSRRLTAPGALDECPLSVAVIFILGQAKCRRNAHA
jgi:hypothetical protein